MIEQMKREFINANVQVNNDPVIKQILEEFHKVDLYAFKDYLSINELRQFEYEEQGIRRLNTELLKKYNKIVSDRLSRTVIINEFVKVTGINKLDLERNYLEKGNISPIEPLTNQEMQKIINIINNCRVKTEKKTNE